VSRISSVSGGSIAAGRLAQVWPEFAASPSVATFTRLVADPLRSFCRRPIDGAAIGGILSPFSTAAEILEREYEEHLVSKTLDQLPDTPAFVFNSTNVQTGRSFRFTKRYMGDYRIGLVREPRLPVAKAVAASSAFPPIFSPVVIRDPGTFEAVEGADLAGDPKFTRKLYLSDGGVYDNLGLETVWDRYSTVLASDAGAPFAMGEQADRDWVRQTMRCLDIATDQSRGLRKRSLVAGFQASLRAGTYWGIDTDIRDYGASGQLACDPAKAARLARMRTRLNPFSNQEQGELVNWGYALADAAVRRYAPQLVTQTGAPQWPDPEFALD
jgi:NTE family protein